MQLGPESAWQQNSPGPHAAAPHAGPLPLGHGDGSGNRARSAANPPASGGADALDAAGAGGVDGADGAPASDAEIDAGGFSG